MTLDPNTALANLRAAIDRFDFPENGADSPDGDVSDALQAARDMSEAAEALDQWLSRGGFLPTPWATR